MRLQSISDGILLGLEHVEASILSQMLAENP